MTQNWTDNILCGGMATNDAHIEDLMNAYTERIKLIRLCAGFTTASFPEATWYYNRVPVVDVPWDATHPDKTLGADNASNRYSWRHIGGIRATVVGSVTGSGNPGYYSSPLEINSTPLGAGGELLFRFHKISGSYYLPYASISELMNEALGSSNWTKQEPFRTVGAVKVADETKPPRIVDINELRAVFEKLQAILIPPTSLKYSYKNAIEEDNVLATAWDNAKASFAAASWSAYAAVGADRPPALDVEVVQGDSHDYKVMITAKRLKATFDLDLEIAGMGWNIFPPLSAKLVVVNGVDGTNEVADLMVKCTKTGDSVNLPAAATDNGVLLTADVTGYCGAGHSAEEFIFTSLNDFSDADLDLMEPSAFCNNTTIMGSRGGFGGLSIIPCWIVLTPNWHYGTA